MDAKEKKRIQKMTDSISLPEEELRELQVSLEIDLGGSVEQNPDRLRALVEEERQQQEQEMEKLLSQTKKTNPAVDTAALTPQGSRQEPATPFEIKNKPETPAPEAAPPEPVEKPPAAIDTRVALRISEDRMHAFLSLTPPQGGGRTPNMKILENYLKKKGVVYGIDRKKLEQISQDIKQNDNPVTDFEIATGKPMEPGTDAVVKVLFEPVSPDDFRGEIDTEGTISIGSVKKNDPLLTITPAIPGRTGYTVLGEEIQAPKVDAALIETKRNTRKASDKIIAESEGLAFYYPDSITVKPYADGRIDIMVSPDNMSCSITLTPAVGTGEKLSEKLVIKALRNRKVTTGISEQTIRDAVEKCEAEKSSLTNIPIASGIPPVNGGDGKIVFKVKLKASHELKKTDSEKVDYREKDSIININKGTLLALHFPPQSKIQDGQDVYGNTILGKDGNPVQLKTGKNIEIKDREDGVKEYYALIDGQTVFEEDKLDMEPLFVVDADLDLETGNIDFYGSVFIKGNIGDGFVVKAGGDVEVGGNVGASSLDAGRDIHVKGGVVSRGTGELRAGRNITARFAESSHLIARDSITIDRAVLNCDIAAGVSVICKREKGQIIGGHTIAKELIEVNELGTPAGTKTTVTLGMDFFKMEQLTSNNIQLRKFLEAQEKIDQVMEKLENIKTAQGELEGDMQRNLVNLMQKKVLVQKKIHEIRKTILLIKPDDNAIPAGEILVHKTLESDIIINMGGHAEMTTVPRDKQRVFADRETGKISYEPLVGKKHAN